MQAAVPHTIPHHITQLQQCHMHIYVQLHTYKNEEKRKKSKVKHCKAVLIHTYSLCNVCMHVLCYCVMNVNAFVSLLLSYLYYNMQTFAHISTHTYLHTQIDKHTYTYTHTYVSTSILCASAATFMWVMHGHSTCLWVSFARISAHSVMCVSALH